MEDQTDHRIARTEALFRDVNEKIAESAERFGAEQTEFVCECSDATCTERVETTLDAYENVREDGAMFIVVDGHEHRGVERVVRRRGSYAVVEKVKPSVRRIVRRLDPRTA
jgi:hypothetical protein